MSPERERGDYPLKATPPRGWTAFVPAWVLRWQLRATQASIGRLEAELGREFGLAETAPLHRELEALLAERDALQARLAERG